MDFVVNTYIGKKVQSTISKNGSKLTGLYTSESYKAMLIIIHQKISTNQIMGLLYSWSNGRDGS